MARLVSLGMWSGKGVMRTQGQGTQVLVERLMETQIPVLWSNALSSSPFRKEGELCNHGLGIFSIFMQTYAGLILTSAAR